MKVKELIALLENQDLEAEVLLMSQENWPFEYAVAGVVARKDFADGEDVNEEDPYDGEGTSGTDVFLVEGTQLRYGSKEAWHAARNY